MAIESVGFDFVNAEWGVDPFTDNYLHEAALANDPPSGKKYGPVSLGVHEHWNNSTDKQYSRNLGKRNGIELVAAFFQTTVAATGRRRNRRLHSNWHAHGSVGAPASPGCRPRFPPRRRGPGAWRSFTTG